MTVDSFAGYLNDYDTEPMGSTIALSMEENWTTTGAHYFKGRAEAAPGAWVYCLVLVTAGNATLQINSSTTTYPTTFTVEPESFYTRR